MNSPFIVEQATRFAQTLLSEEISDEERIELAFLKAYSRFPSESQVKQAVDLINDQMDSKEGEGLNPEKLKLAKDDAIVMHPGPMNRGVEISTSVADGPQNVILDQVANGVAVRMALLYLVSGAENMDVE